MAELNFKGFLYLTVGKHSNRGKVTRARPVAATGARMGAQVGRVQAGAGGSRVVSTQGFALPVGSILSVFVFSF